jgi:hypothetical protein
VNETSGTTGSSAFGANLIERVTEGMTVVDPSGEKIGKVEYVQMGDPEAATVEGNEPPRQTIFGQIGQAVAGDEREPDVEEPLRSQLLRYGFLKVDAAGLFGSDRYVRGDLIRAVSGDRVTVAAATDELPKEE